MNKKLKKFNVEKKIRSGGDKSDMRQLSQLIEKKPQQQKELTKFSVDKFATDMDVIMYNTATLKPGYPLKDMVNGAQQINSHISMFNLKYLVKNRIKVCFGG